MSKRSTNKFVNGDGVFPKREAAVPAGMPVSSPGRGPICDTSPGISGWLVWQLMDSAFPTGAFVHSSGLEATWQYGEVSSRDQLVSFVEASLEQLGHAGLPFVLAAFDQPKRLPEFDELCDAFTSNHVANRSSRSQGRALLIAVERIFRLSPKAPDAGAITPFAHFAPAFGACLRWLGLSRGMAGRMYFFNQLRGILAAAVRLNIIGPMEAQMLLYRLSPKAEAILTECLELTLDEIAQTTPTLDLWQGAHDRLYSRLFQS